MIRVLIVDDERLVREMLKSIIEWGDTFKCVGEASDGVDAYHLALNLRPEIIITDVRMPGMDGLTMVSKLSDLLPQTEVIVISGFDEFEYVKKAIDLGAIGYALKPVKEKEINSALQKAKKKIQEHQINQSVKESLLTAAEKTIGDFYNDIPTDEVKLIEVLSLMGYYPGFQYGCFLLQIMHESLEFQIVKKELSWALIDEEKENHSLIFGLAPYLLGVLFVGRKAPDLTTLAKRIMSNMKNRGEIKGISIALGDVCDSPEKIRRSVLLAKSGLLLIHPYAHNELILPGHETVSKVSFPFHLEEDLIQALYSANPNELNVAIKNIGDFFADSRITAADMKRMLMIIHGDVLRTAYKEKIEKSVLNRGIELSRHITNASSWEQISVPFESFCRAVSTGFTTQSGEMMERILMYLQSNFHDPVNLGRIASAHNMSQSNFSLTFKRYTNMTFSDYVLRLRMEKAKELLLQKKYKIHRVSEMVGYEDCGYFGKLFKRYTGILPSEYPDKK